MDYKKSYILLHLGYICGIGITFFGLWLSMKIAVIGNILAFFGFIAMLLGIGQAFLFFRCPKCKKLLPIRGKKPKHCPACGEKLDLTLE